MGSAESAGEGVPAIDIDRATYDYRSRRGVSRRIGPVSLRVMVGERVALIGPNASGKSTLLHMLATASTPTTGTVRWFGSEAPAPARRRLGVVFQSPALDDLLTIRETLELSASVLRLPASVGAARADETARAFGLADRLADRVGTLSGGLKRRVDLARAMLHGPDILLLDEPTVGLDGDSAHAFNDTLDELAAQGMTIVHATHTLDEVARATRVVVMVDGAVGLDRGTGATGTPGTALHVEGRPVDPRSHDDAELGGLVRSAIDRGVSVDSSGGSMQAYFDEAAAAIAEGRP